MSPIIQYLNQIKAQITQAKITYHRGPGNVKLVGARPKQPMGKLRAVVEEGPVDLGRPNLQGALSKPARLKNYNIQWHYLGRPMQYYVNYKGRTGLFEKRMPLIIPPSKT